MHNTVPFESLTHGNAAADGLPRQPSHIGRVAESGELRS